MKKILLGVLAVFLVILIGAGGYIFKLIGAITNAQGLMAEEPEFWEADGDTEDFGISEEAPSEKETGVINILLLGSDRRNQKEHGRSDAIMIASLDTKNGQLKLSSIMRDLYVSIPGRQDNRINAAFSFGGPKLALQTINQNLNLNLTRYVTVDFFGLEGIINAIDGVEIDIKKKEVNHFNKVLDELNKLDKSGRKSPHLTEPGLQTLDGKQAVAYSRIRKVGDGDSERTERQRKVMIQIFSKMKSISPLKLPDLVAAMVPYVNTNISTTDMISLGASVLGIKDRNIYQYRVPAKDTYKGQTIRGMAVYVADMEKNTQLLHDFLQNKAEKE
ncbi:MAG: LCP family protein [Clostridiales bacterium]|nr:LCP family protein [Clostridiales bacterium]